MDRQDGPKVYFLSKYYYVLHTATGAMTELSC